MSTYEEDCREEDELFARLMFEEICELRPEHSIRVERVDGVFRGYVKTKGVEWQLVGTGDNACCAMDGVVQFLGITEEEIEANEGTR